MVSGSKSTHEKAIKRVSELIGAGKAENTLDKYFNIASAHPYHWNDNPLFAEYTDTGKMTDTVSYTHLDVYKRQEFSQAVYNIIKSADKAKSGNAYYTDIKENEPLFEAVGFLAETRCV